MLRTSPALRFRHAPMVDPQQLASAPSPVAFTGPGQPALDSPIRSDAPHIHGSSAPEGKVWHTGADPQQHLDSFRVDAPIGGIGCCTVIDRFGWRVLRCRVVQSQRRVDRPNAIKRQRRPTDVRWGRLSRVLLPLVPPTPMPQDPCKPTPVPGSASTFLLGGPLWRAPRKGGDHDNYANSD
jgi:hypothetical protein